MISWLILLPLALVFPAAPTHGSVVQEESQQATAIPVGVPRWSRDVVLGGTALKVRPADTETPLIVRIDSISPHGTDLRPSGLERIEGGDGTSTVGCIQQDDPSAEVDLWKG